MGTWRGRSEGLGAVFEKVVAAAWEERELRLRDAVEGGQPFHTAEVGGDEGAVEGVHL